MGPRDPIDIWRKRLVEDFRVVDAGRAQGIEGEIEAIVAEADRLRAALARTGPRERSAARLCGADQPRARSRHAAPKARRERKVGWKRCATASPKRCGTTAILYFGEGTGERGGSFAHTKELWPEFGPQRMVDTPISELGFTAAAVGASATGAARSPT